MPKAAEDLLDDMEGRNCDFFFNEASPKTGLVRDRAPSNGRSLSRAAVDCLDRLWAERVVHRAKRHYLRPLDCEQRVEKTLAYLLNECPHEHGFLYHFIDIESGKRMFGCELSSIDTSLLLCGILHCRTVLRGQRADREPGDDALPAGGLAMDAEWRRHALHGLAAGAGLPEASLGYLRRADDDVPAGDRRRRRTR